MKIIHGIRNIDKTCKGGVLTLGIFDGVHIGHRKVLKKVVARARIRHLKSIVITFFPHPLEILAPEKAPPLLTSLQKRIELLEGMGIDICIIINFTSSFSRIRAGEFVSTALVKRLSVKELVVSKDITFGYRAQGDIGLLSSLSKKEGFRLIKVTPVYKNGNLISSTRIRRVIRHGSLVETEKLLGRPYSLTGTVMKGYRIGRLLGFATANIRPHHEVLPPPGVYCGYVIYGKKKFRALANFGFRPTFYGREKSFEVHMIDFKGNIYHKELEFIFKWYLRPERHFSTKHALIRQIEKDKEEAMRKLPFLSFNLICEAKFT